jgi:chemosensory pili system protein ChpC
MSAQKELNGPLPEAQLEEVQCVVIPLLNSSVLLPNVCIAEILPWRRVKALQSVPDWLIGLLGWRGETLPVVNFEMLNEHPEARIANGRCLVIMNRAGLKRGPSFYAIVAEGLPRLVQVAAEDLTPGADVAGPYSASDVKLGTETVIIPNLEAVERQIKMLSLGD